MFKTYFQKTLSQHKGHLLFQAHSHHCWPDFAFDAMNDYQLIVQKKLDHKWDDVFQSIIPRAQKIVAKLLGWPHPQSISFGQNTQELLVKLLSALPRKDSKPLKVCTTHFEYHSARRLFQQLQVQQQIICEAINTEWKDIPTELATQLAQQNYDVCFISQSFFHSGYTLTEKYIIELAQKFPETFFIIDCYHSFAARGLNFASERSNVAILGGGYKYAMSGEGCCFLAFHPKTQFLEPQYNGWMAEFSALNKNIISINQAPISTTGYHKFLGATFDPIGLYRLVHVWENFFKQDVSPLKIKKYVEKLQTDFWGVLDEQLAKSFLKFPDHHQGNFLSLKLKNQQSAENFIKILQQRSIFIDGRDQYARFGFGAYQDSSDVLDLACQLNALMEEIELVN